MAPHPHASHDLPPRHGPRRRWGPAYLFTAVTAQRQPLFADWRCARAAAACLAARETWPQARLLCWVLLPDRWQGLLLLERQVPRAGLVARAKGNAAHVVNRARGRGGAVWGPGFEERAMDAATDLCGVGRALVALPLRAGLAERVGLYPYWDAVWLQGKRRD